MVRYNMQKYLVLMAPHCRAKTSIKSQTGADFFSQEAVLRLRKPENGSTVYLASARRDFIIREIYYDTHSATAGTIPCSASIQILRNPHHPPAEPLSHRRKPVVASVELIVE